MKEFIIHWGHPSHSYRRKSLEHSPEFGPVYLFRHKHLHRDEKAKLAPPVGPLKPMEIQRDSIDLRIALGRGKATKIEDKSKKPLWTSFLDVSFTLSRLLKSFSFVARSIRNNYAYHFSSNQSISRSSLSHIAWWMGYIGDENILFSR